MPGSRIACCNPGRLGDALYCLPAIRWLATKHGGSVHFFTSEYCRPMLGLMQWQSCIDQVGVCPEYVALNGDCGVQPWEMPVPGGYDHVYQLGLRSRPDCRLVDFIARSAGAPDGLPVQYECLPDMSAGLPERYVVVSPSRHGWHRRIMKYVIPNIPLPVVQVGTRGEWIDVPSIDFTGRSLLETVSIFHRAVAFIGPLSSQLVLASGFPIPRIIPFTEENDLVPGEHTQFDHYVGTPRPETVLDTLLPLL